MTHMAIYSQRSASDPYGHILAKEDSRHPGSKQGDSLLLSHLPPSTFDLD